MATDHPSAYPGGSKERVNRAGIRIRQEKETDEDVVVFETWRKAHHHVINSFQSILRNRTRGTQITVVQRHKRKRTIVDKLNRFPKMQLSRMDDVAGCRLIFPSIEELRSFRSNFHNKSRFKHRMKNKPGKYDYINNPKHSGYRSIHDIYVYDVNSIEGKGKKGLLIELQYRTLHQHAWATCVELVGSLTGDQPKFDRGTKEMRRILRVASEIIARSFENSRSSLPELSNKDVVNEFRDLDKSLDFLPMLENVIMDEQELDAYKFVILTIGTGENDKRLEVRAFEYIVSAQRELFDLERKYPELDTVLVSGNKWEDVRRAFNNYFSDAGEFVTLIREGCEKLESG